MINVPIMCISKDKHDIKDYLSWVPEALVLAAPLPH